MADMHNSNDLFWTERLNTCPYQGSRTIRTEEAVLISLTALSAAISTSSRSEEAVKVEEPPIIEFSDEAPSDENSDSDKVSDEESSKSSGCGELSSESSGSSDESSWEHIRLTRMPLRRFPFVADCLSQGSIANKETKHCNIE